MNLKISYERILVFILAAVQFTHIVDFMIMMPLGDILQKELDINPFQYSILVSSYPVAAFFSSLFGVFFLDRWDRKKALTVAYLGFILGTLSSAILPTTELPSLNYFVFIGTRILTGLFGGILSALILAILGDAFSLERRGSAMGVVMTAFSLAAVLGVPFALQLVNWFDGNWHVPFYMVGIIGVPVISLAWFKMKSMRGHISKGDFKPSPMQYFQMAAGNRNQVEALAFSVLIVFGQFTVIPFITPYMINNVGLTQDQIPLIYLVGGACTVITSPLVGKIVDKLGRKTVFYSLAIISIVPIILITHMPQWNIIFVLMVTALFFIAVSGRGIPANTLITAVVKPENRGGFLSLNASVRNLATGAASVVAGIVVSQPGENVPMEGFNVVGYLAALSTIVAMFLAYRLVEKY